jgi:hypothetical protein
MVGIREILEAEYSVCDCAHFTKSIKSACNCKSRFQREL